MEYFLTGGTGFLGGALADRLLADGHDVVALARDPTRATGLEAAGATVVEGDITQKASMRDAMAGVDGVFHVAGWYDVGPDDPTLGDPINVEGTRNVMELVVELDIPRAVYTSTLAVNSDTDGVLVDESYRYYGPHLTDYDRTKWEAHYGVVEPMVDDGAPIITVMPGLIYGPGDTSASLVLWDRWFDGDLPAIPRKTAYCWSHVDDVAAAHLRAMEAGDLGASYIVAGEPMTLVEAFDLAAELTGRDPPRAVSPRLFTAMSKIAALAERVVDLPKAYRAESLRVLGGVTYLGDNSTARAELDLEHRPLADGLAEYLRWVQTR